MAVSSFKIGNIEIGCGKIPIVIPEIGINHGGNLEIAKKMVLAASRSGAKIVKHQTHVVWDEMSEEAKKVIPGNSTESIYEIMYKNSLSEEDELELKKYTESLGIHFFSTPFSRAAADRLERFGVDVYKIGSGEMNNYPLIRHIASFHKPMIISTGMNDIRNIEKTVNILENNNIPYALMHTTNVYPTPKSLVRLGAMIEMMDYFKGVPIGLSDHTTDNIACICAMALGACIVERHFTDTMERKGPDIICSMDENALHELLVAAESVHSMLGGQKESIQEEQVTIDFAFSTVVAIKDIKKGDILDESNIWVKRPGTGKILAERYTDLLGKRAKIDILSGVHLDETMFQ